MNLTKRIGAALLAILLLTGAAACGAQKDDAPQSGAAATTESAPIETTAAAETTPDRAHTPDSLPDDLDFGGETVTVFYRSSIELEVAGSTDDDAVYDAIHSRNMKVEDRLHVNLAYNPSSSGGADVVNAQLRQYILADDESIDCVANTMWVALRQATEHYYINLKDAPYLDFSQPWWQGEAMDSLQVGEDRLFFLSGEILLSNILHIGAIYFNKDIFDAHFGDSRNLYQLVLDGGWTYDRFAEYSEQVYTDVNGNGIKDGEDVFGFYADLGSSVDHFTFASDVELSRRGEDGLPELTILSDRLVQLTEVLYKLYYENAGVMVDNDEGRHHELFAGGYTLFHPFRLVAGTLPALREMESDYGIIPYPKLDAEQKEYRTLIHNASSIVFVPITCRKAATVCAVLEALAAESHRSVTEIGYETLLKRKYSRDDVSSQMIDLIYAAARKDFAYNYAVSLSNAGFITREVIAARSADIASYYAKREKAYTLTLNKLIEFYTGG